MHREQLSHLVLKSIATAGDALIGSRDAAADRLAR
jgi:hypothetical protein